MRSGATGCAICGPMVPHRDADGARPGPDASALEQPRVQLISIPSTNASAASPARPATTTPPAIPRRSVAGRGGRSRPGLIYAFGFWPIVARRRQPRAAHHDHWHILWHSERHAHRSPVRQSRRRRPCRRSKLPASPPANPEGPHGAERSMGATSTRDMRRVRFSAGGSRCPASGHSRQPTSQRPRTRGRASAHVRAMVLRSSGHAGHPQSCSGSQWVDSAAVRLRGSRPAAVGRALRERAPSGTGRAPRQLTSPASCGAAAQAGRPSSAP